jgi:hypothetical protein
MAGIAFYHTPNREEVVAFYIERLDATVWLEQEGGCTILQRENFLFGFCDGDAPEGEATLTFVVDSTDAVDAFYEELSDVASGEPEENETFEIYQFFAEDPDGRAVEIQTFLHPIPPAP